jgi:hypothetical protein
MARMGHPVIWTDDLIDNVVDIWTAYLDAMPDAYPSIAAFIRHYNKLKTDQYNDDKKSGKLPETAQRPQTLTDDVVYGRSELDGIRKKASGLAESMLLDRLVDGKGAPVAAIFLLKALHRYKDNAEKAEQPIVNVELKLTDPDKAQDAFLAMARESVMTRQRLRTDK